MLISELAYSKILPALRGVLAHRLVSAGLTQRRVAEYLDVSQPMVHKLLRRPLEEYYSELERLGIPRGLLDYYVDILVYLASRGDYERYTYIAFNILNHLATRAVCSVYSYKFTELCAGGVLRDPHIDYYKSLLLRVVSISGLERVIPEVGSNLAYAVHTPASLSDVIGLTGGIVKTISGVVFYGEPVYGGSRHVGRVLVEASKFNPEVRLCFNTKCASSLRGVLEERGYHVEVTGPHLSEEDFWGELVNALSKRPDAVCDLGGLGLEPVMYVFARSFSELEEMLRLIVGATRG
jgi:predicted fused transcriptional regulator/phosphomethylpyrimidine kinase/predicted transcriptional regulator